MVSGSFQEETVKKVQVGQKRKVIVEQQNESRNFYHQTVQKKISKMMIFFYHQTVELDLMVWEKNENEGV